MTAYVTLLFSGLQPRYLQALAGHVLLHSHRRKTLFSALASEIILCFTSIYAPYTLRTRRFRILSFYIVHLLPRLLI